MTTQPETITAMQRQLYSIGIFEDEIVVSDFREGAEQRFLVSPEQLMGFFRSEITLRPFPGLIWMRSDGCAFTYLLTLPAGPRTILYRKKKKLTDKRLYLPSMAAEAKIEDGRVVRLRIWGFSGKELRPESVLYELPLPNLNGANVCLGSTKVESRRGDIADLVERVFFDTPFNNHSDLVGKEKVTFAKYHAKHGGRCPLRTLNRIGHGRDIIGRQS